MSDGTALEPIALPPAPAAAPAETPKPAPAVLDPAQPEQKPSGEGSAPHSPDRSTSKESAWATLWLTDRDVAIFTGLAAIVLVLLMARWAQLSGWGTHEIEIERLAPLEYNYRLDVNEATWVELAQLEGIGESLAQRIVEDRDTAGPFRSVDDLDRVKGIGPKTLERLRPYLKADSQFDDSSL